MAPLVRRSWAPCGATPPLHQRVRLHRKVSVIAALAVALLMSPTPSQKNSRPVVISA